MFSDQHCGTKQTVTNIHIIEFGESLDLYNPASFHQFSSLETWDFFIKRCIIEIIKQIQKQLKICNLLNQSQNVSMPFCLISKSDEIHNVEMSRQKLNLKSINLKCTSFLGRLLYVSEIKKKWGNLRKNLSRIFAWIPVADLISALYF